MCRATHVRIEHPVHIRGEPLLPVPASCLTYSREASRRVSGTASGRRGSSSEFPLVRPLPSTASAAGCPALFGGVCGTIKRSDFSRSCIIGVRLSTSRCARRRSRLPRTARSPGSRTRCFRACTGSSTARGPIAPRGSGALDVAFRFFPQRRHPGVVMNFAAQYPARTFPCQRFADAVAHADA